SKMIKRVLWILAVILAILIGLYPSIYFLMDRNFGLLSSKSNEILTSTIWNIAFYMHIILGGLALLIGWMQFNSKIRSKRVQLHRLMGKVYIVSVFFSSPGLLYCPFCNRWNHSLIRFYLFSPDLVLYYHDSLYQHP